MRVGSSKSPTFSLTGSYRSPAHSITSCNRSPTLSVTCCKKSITLSITGSNRSPTFSILSLFPIDLQHYLSPAQVVYCFSHILILSFQLYRCRPLTRLPKYFICLFFINFWHLSFHHRVFVLHLSFYSMYMQSPEPQFQFLIVYFPGFCTI